MEPRRNYCCSCRVIRCRPTKMWSKAAPARRHLAPIQIIDAFLSKKPSLDLSPTIYYDSFRQRKICGGGFTGLKCGLLRLMHVRSDGGNPGMVGRSEELQIIRPRRWTRASNVVGCTSTGVDEGEGEAGRIRVQEIYSRMWYTAKEIHCSFDVSTGLALLPRPFGSTLSFCTN